MENISPRQTEDCLQVWRWQNLLPHNTGLEPGGVPAHQSVRDHQRRARKQVRDQVRDKLAVAGPAYELLNNSYIKQYSENFKGDVEDTLLVLSSIFSNQKVHHTFKESDGPE